MTGEPDAADFDRWLDGCRERFGDPPRRVGWWAAHVTLWVPPPPGLTFTDDLTQLLYRRAELLRHGPLVWGHVIACEPSHALPGVDDRFASLVFCPQPGGGPTVPQLRAMAAALAALDVDADLRPELAAIARHLADPLSRRCGLPVPAGVAGRHPCEVSTVWVVRRHLPERQLLSPYVPLVVLPDQPRVAMVLPARYWPADLIAHWTEPPL